MEYDDFDTYDFDYVDSLPSPREHARECWEWFRDVTDALDKREV